MISQSAVSPRNLLEEEKLLILPSLKVEDGLEIGRIANSFGVLRKLPIAVEVRIGDWVIYHASLPGSTAANQDWINRKARVVQLKHHSTLYERVNSEVLNFDWFKENNLTEDTHAIHGGGIPLITHEDGFLGCLLISGLPQVEDHYFGIEVLTEFLASKAELH